MYETITLVMSGTDDRSAKYEVTPFGHECHRFGGLHHEIILQMLHAPEIPGRSDYHSGEFLRGSERLYEHGRGRTRLELLSDVAECGRPKFPAGKGKERFRHVERWRNWHSYLLKCLMNRNRAANNKRFSR